MAVNIRQNGSWNNITFDIAPFAVSGTWSDETSNRFYRDISMTDVEQAKRIYTNTSGNLMLVRAVPGIDRIPRGLNNTEISGSFAIAYVDDLEVARFRDNGTNAADKLRIELQFFVPQGSEYYVKCYKADHPPDDANTSWQGTSTNGVAGDANDQPIIETIEWFEFTFQ